MAKKRRDPIRVAIVGGGCAAMTTAFELTRPALRGKYAVTVYSMGFRLGGKGASGRGVHDRIEEHGLHLWMGFYENGFRLMRECYDELGRDPEEHPIAAWTDAFKPADRVAIGDRSPNGDWEPWIAQFPPMRGLPGDPLAKDNPFSVTGYLTQAVHLVGELIRSAQPHDASGKKHKKASIHGEIESVLLSAAEVLGATRLASTAAMIEAAELLRALTTSLLPDALADEDGPLLRLVDALADRARDELDALVDGDPALERIWQVIDLILAIVRGVVRCGLVTDPRGFDAIDRHEWTAWLREHGASERALGSGFMRGIYDLMFAFENGDASKRCFSAAVALRGAMRMFFTYRGALFWRMSAGMGDIVFAPLYEVLKRRGVRFRFFHKLRDVALSPDVPGELPHVTALHFDVQANIIGGRAYQPLVDVRGLPCWPAKPDYAQLVRGAEKERDGWAFEAAWETRRAGTKTLRVGRNFDLVVLGQSLGAIPGTCGQLIDRLPAWKAMVKHLRTSGTQAFQLWLKKDLRALGWKHGSVNLSGFVEPFDTWADMSHLAEQESLPDRVETIAYFCSPLPEASAIADPGSRAHQRDEHAKVRDRAVGFLNRDLGALWPKAVTRDPQFRWDLLVGGDPAATGEARFDGQFWTANVLGTDRYVLSVPGSSKHRISPLDRSVDNLTITGDWTETGLNTGCVESAVMGGMLAAHAISRSPPLSSIIGYDHP